MFVFSQRYESDPRLLRREGGQLDSIQALVEGSEGIHEEI